MKSPSTNAQAPEARATINDVAKLAGVSKATISRFLNPSTKPLSPEITARVQTAIAELSYVPSPMARALKRGRSRLIGLVVADVTNPFSVAVLRGAEDEAQKAGYLVMLFNLGNSRQRECEGIEALASYQVEGIILNTLGEDPAMAQQVARHGKPAVLVDRKVAGLQADYVSLDNEDAVRQAVAHLLDQGWRELLYVTEPMAGVSTRFERTAAFRQNTAHAATDPTFGPATAVGASVLEVGNDDDEALDKALRALKQRSGNRPPAVLASNVRTTLHVATAVARLGWRLGQDIGFVGIDETPWAPLVGPGLSTIAQPTDEIGRQAVRCLLERMQGQQNPPRQVLLAGRLVVRDSSKMPNP